MTNPSMEYRRLGSSGLKVSALGFGSWVTFDTQMDLTPALECMQAARDAGCNFFDNAEAYCPALVTACLATRNTRERAP